MAQNSTVLLQRIFSQRETQHLILVLDTIAQSSAHLLNEFIHHTPEEMRIIFVSFETAKPPKWSSHFIEAGELSTKRVVEAIDSTVDTQLRNLVVVDSISSVPNSRLSEFITAISRPNVSILATLHTSLPELDSQHPNYPSTFSLLTFIASTVFEVVPKVLDEDTETQLSLLRVPGGLNSPLFRLNLTSRRKSGRSLSYSFHINALTHEYTPIMERQEEQLDTQQLLKGLTTFNLTTSKRQQEARENVELPYLEAQSFEAGGAIVYEFEKDDDYDEEDPYEDPF